MSTPPKQGLGRRHAVIASILLPLSLGQALAADAYGSGTAGQDGQHGIAAGQSGTAGSAGGPAVATVGPNADAFNFARAYGGYGGRGGDGAPGSAQTAGGSAGAGGMGGSATATAYSFEEASTVAYGGSGGMAGMPGADGGTGPGANAPAGHGGAAQANAHVTSTPAAGVLSAQAMAYGGRGGNAFGPGQSAGRGGEAGIQLTGTQGASHPPTAIYMRGMAEGGRGGEGLGGANGGAGAVSEVVNAVSGSASYLIMEQWAAGGWGGKSSGGLGGQGGNALSSLSFNDQNALGIEAYVKGTGGPGGSSDSQRGGAGGHGRALINISAAGNVRLTGSSEGGGGYGAPGLGAAAGDAFTHVTGASGSKGLFEAYAVGGYAFGTPHGRATASIDASAQSGEAHANSTTGNNAAYSSRRTVTTDARAWISGPVAHTVHVYSQASDGDTSPLALPDLSVQSNGQQAVSVAVGLSDKALLDQWVGQHEQVGEAIAQAPEVVGAGYMVLNHAEGAMGPQTYSANASFIHMLAPDEKLMLGLLDFTGRNAQAPIELKLKISQGGFSVLDLTFTSLSMAQAFMSDQAITLGNLSGYVELSVAWTMTSQPGQGAGFSYVLATTAVPEAPHWALALIGLAIVCGTLHRRQSRRHLTH